MIQKFPKEITKKLNYLSKRENVEIFNNKSFSKLAIEFLSEISNSILKDKSLKKYPDLISYSFWARKRYLELFKGKYETSSKFGRGLTFHITPSNVALNFLYSFSFSLLAGNSNIVRLPSKKFKEVDIFLEIYKSLKKKKFRNIYNSNVFIKYNHDDQINNFFSSISDTRMIWGGDKTVNKFKSYETKPFCLDLNFPDRYSISVINVKKLSKITDEEMKKLIINFYNDTYLFDQMACNSPHLIIWQNYNKNTVKNFWDQLRKYVKIKYKLDYSMVIDKLTKLQMEKLNNKNIETVVNFENNLTLVSLKKFSKDIIYSKVGYGYFYQIKKGNLKEIIENLDKKVQTLTYYGFDKLYFQKIIKKKAPIGIDRIVPIGQSSKMNLTWDGFDLINNLSKHIEII